MCGPLTRTRGRNKKSNGHDPKQDRRRNKNGNNRSRKFQTGFYQHSRGAKAEQPSAAN